MEPLAVPFTVEHMTLEVQAPATIPVLVHRTRPDAFLPSSAYPGDAGWDLHALEDTFIPPGEGRDVRTGLNVCIPEGYYGRIVGRSSSFRKRGLLVIEGVIDCGFRGELYSYAFCPDRPGVVHRGFLIERGMAIAQLIVSPIPRVVWEEVPELPQSERGEAGFGSSGR